jgi:hypothetical protein
MMLMESMEIFLKLVYGHDIYNKISVQKTRQESEARKKISELLPKKTMAFFRLTDLDNEVKFFINREKIETYKHDTWVSPPHWRTRSLKEFFLGAS